MKEIILEQQAEDFELINQLFTENKELDNTLAKSLLTDSRGQYKDQKNKLDRLERRDAQQRLQQLSDGFPGLEPVVQPKQQQRQKNDNGWRPKPRRRRRKGQINELRKTTYQNIQSKWPQHNRVNHDLRNIPRKSTRKTRTFKYLYLRSRFNCNSLRTAW